MSHTSAASKKKPCVHLGEHIHPTKSTSYKSDWEKKIEEILVALNGFFQSGVLRASAIGDIVSDSAFTAIIERNQSLVSDAMRAASVADTTVRATISFWWKQSKAEYHFDEQDEYMAYAKYILLNWVNKFTFANVIKSKHNPAITVESIVNTVTPLNAIKVFAAITQKCDFFNIFAEIEYAHILPDSTWDDLTDFNAFLVENGISDISQTALQSVLESSVNQFKRNIVGQFTTPEKLAKILVRAGIDNLTLPSIDPCCGTGTIAKAILEEKVEAVGLDAAYTSTFASDKYSFPLQISNIALTRADAMNLPSLLFQQNAFALKPGDSIQIRDPMDGQNKSYVLPEWGSIVSNLPFVAFDQKGREESSNIKVALDQVRKDTSIGISRRTDLYQVLLLHFWHTLADNASVAVITSNSWLGTDAGEDFFKALNYYYDVKSVVASGEGKWFDNAAVIAVLLFLKKKNLIQPPNLENKIGFGLITHPLDTASDEDISEIADLIKLQKSGDGTQLKLNKWTQGDIGELIQLGVAINSLLYDISWLPAIKHCLCPVSDLFKVFRGRKTGQDDFYYLKDASAVDSAYVERILKTPKSVETLIAEPDTDSLICDKSLEELSALGHHKTINWIRNHQGHLNQSVTYKDTFWMNMLPERYADNTPIQLFTALNPDRRYFYGFFDNPTKINQRSVGFLPVNDEIDLSLCHALQNSLIGAFYTEASGFPRGQSVLDRSKSSVKRLWLLDPRKLSTEQVKKILAAFKPLLSRKILPFDEELCQKDRLNFEHVVLSCYGIDTYFDRITTTLLEMQRVRLSVKSKG